MGDGTERQGGGLNSSRRGRNPTRALVEETTGVSVREGDWLNSCFTELAEDRLAADDFEQCLIGKSLLVITDRCGRIDAGQDRRLAGGTLRTPLDAESRIGRHHDAFEKRFRNFVLKDCEWRSVGKVVERIERTASADAQAVNEEQQDRSVTRRHEASHARDKDSACYAGS